MCLSYPHSGQNHPTNLDSLLMIPLSCRCHASGAFYDVVCSASSFSFQSVDKIVKCNRFCLILFIIDKQSMLTDNFWLTLSMSFLRSSSDKRLWLGGLSSISSNKSSDFATLSQSVVSVVMALSSVKK